MAKPLPKNRQCPRCGRFFRDGDRRIVSLHRWVHNGCPTGDVDTPRIDYAKRSFRSWVDRK